MTPATRVTDPTLPISVQWPIRDDNVYTLWLAPGDWTRGRAFAHVAEHDGNRFTALRARRVYLRWQQGGRPRDLAGWQFEDGWMVACERDDKDAERYWEFTDTTEATA